MRNFAMTRTRFGALAQRGTAAARVCVVAVAGLFTMDGSRTPRT